MAVPQAPAPRIQQFIGRKNLKLRRSAERVNRNGGAPKGELQPVPYKGDEEKWISADFGSLRILLRWEFPVFDVFGIFREGAFHLLTQLCILLHKRRHITGGHTQQVIGH